MRGQRRRGPPRRAPKNIFSPGAKTEPKKAQKAPIPNPPAPKAVTAPPKAALPPTAAGARRRRAGDIQITKAWAKEKGLDHR